MATDWHPDRFHVRIGGSPPFYSVEWENDCLVYRAETGTIQVEQVHPTPRQWKTFWAKMDRLAVWDWKTAFGLDLVMDGIYWEIEIGRGGRSVQVEGDTGSPQTEGFLVLAKAVSWLIGAREFS